MPKAPGAMCNQCPLRDEEFVGPFTPDCVARYFVIGEAPGRNEVVEGRPFIGQSGQLLSAAFEFAGGNLDEAYLTNTVLCRPPGNRTPTEQEIACCRPRLALELEQYKNLPILSLGKTACENLGVDFSQRGAWLDFYMTGQKVKPAWHPTYVLRRPGEAAIFLAEIASYLRGPEAAKNFDPEVFWMQSVDELARELNKVPDNVWTAFDIETDQVVWYDRPGVARDSILMLQLAWCEDYGLVIGDDLLYDSSEARALLRKFFPRVKTVGHNAKFDAVFMRSHLDINPEVNWDTLLAQYILDENMPRGLKILSALEFGIPDYEEELIAKYLKTRNDRYSKVDPDALAKYGVLDVVCTLQLRERQEPRLIENGQLETPFQSIIMPASRALEDVELRGFLVAEDAINAVDKELQDAIDAHVALVREIAGEPSLNPNSSVQMSEVFYQKLKLPQPKGRRINPGSTNAEALEKLKDKHPIVPAVKEYRRVKKLHSSYVKNVYDFRDTEGRVHGNFLIYGTEVGRLSVRDPALQTIPRGDDVYGGKIRGMYQAKPGFKLIHADYSQAEMRVMACYSQEPFLMEAYRNERDLHSEVAKAMYGENFTKAQRVICKMFNFSYLYGGTEYSFAEGSGLPIDIARQFVRDYNANMPRALAWKREQFMKAKTDGYVETMFHRRRHFPLIVPDNLEDVKKSCVHMVIASTASDFTLMSLTRLSRVHHVPVVSSVHDSILAEVPEDEADEIAILMQKVMVDTASYYMPDIPWKVDADVSQAWYGGEKRTYSDGKWTTS